MRTWLLAVVCVLGLAGTLTAQQAPPAVAGDKFAWDYVEADIASYGVNRFEIQVDAGAWTAVGIPAAFTDAQTGAGKKSYSVPFPAMQPGNHTISVRACNADVCSAGIAPFGFRLAIVPAEAGNGRIVKGDR